MRWSRTAADAGAPDDAYLAKIAHLFVAPVGGHSSKFIT